MTTSVEIIEFFRPEGGRKNLFVTNLPGNASEDVIQETLVQDFSKYGLLFEVQVFPAYGKATKGDQSSTAGQSIQERTTNETRSDTGHAENRSRSSSDLQLSLTGWYAFVKFYSSMAASNAKAFLNGKLVLGLSYKINYAKRRAFHDQKPPVLYITKCHELANYYLGFNGWSSTIRFIENDTQGEEISEKVRFLCSVRVNLTNQGLSSDGIGVSEDKMNPNDPSSKCQIVGRVKKLAYQMAIENAFSKVVLVVLANGKVTAEINTTKVDRLLKNAQLDESGLLKINDLDFEPESEDADISTVLDEDKPEMDFPEPTDSILDNINLQLLQQLEDS